MDDDVKSTYDRVLAEADGHFFTDDLLPIDGKEVDISKYATPGRAALISVVRITFPKHGRRYVYIYRRVPDEERVEGAG